MEKRIEDEPLIEVVREEVRDIPAGHVVVAAGPLCSDALAERIREKLGAESLAFFDAAAPIVDAASLDRTQALVDRLIPEVLTRPSRTRPSDLHPT